MTARSLATGTFGAVRARSRLGRVWSGRNRYLTGALCLVLCAVMVTPIALSMLASVKTTAEAAASPPNYLPGGLSLDGYQRLWAYQRGLPHYLANSLGTALLTIAFTVGLTVPAGYALARLPIPGKSCCSSSC